MASRRELQIQSEDQAVNQQYQASQSKPIAHRQQRICSAKLEFDDKPCTSPDQGWDQEQKKIVAFQLDQFNTDLIYGERPGKDLI